MQDEPLIRLNRGIWGSHRIGPRAALGLHFRLLLRLQRLLVLLRIDQQLVRHLSDLRHLQPLELVFPDDLLRLRAATRVII